MLADMRPTDHVLDMFAVPGDVEAVPGGQGLSVRAGDLMLSPGRDPQVHEALKPRLARLAVTLDTRPGRDRRDLRIAMPVPARDGSWVVDGWGATRYEPGTTPLTDLTATRAVGAVLHAELARWIPEWPPSGGAPAYAERVAFGEAAPVEDALDPRAAALLSALIARRDDAPLGPDQLVHSNLAGDVLLDPDGAPIVTEVAPCWRPTVWADAVSVLDSVMWFGADHAIVQEWTIGPPGQAMIRAAIFRLLGDHPCDATALRRALAPLLATHA